MPATSSPSLLSPTHILRLQGHLQAQHCSPALPPLFLTPPRTPSHHKPVTGATPQPHKKDSPQQPPRQLPQPDAGHNPRSTPGRCTAGCTDRMQYMTPRCTGSDSATSWFHVHAGSYCSPYVQPPEDPSHQLMPLHSTHYSWPCDRGSAASQTGAAHHMYHAATCSHFPPCLQASCV